jgi:hypothetical protein
MKVQSTGLGKTVMVAQFKELLKTDFDNQQVLQLTMEATEPLHWTIKVYMEPKDVRTAIGFGLKPSVVWKALLAAIFGRYSLFRTGAPDAEKSTPAPVTQTSKSLEPSASINDDHGTGPLANLKEDADKDETPNPLQKLKG